MRKSVHTKVQAGALPLTLIPAAMFVLAIVHVTAAVRSAASSACGAAIREIGSSSPPAWVPT